MTPSNVLLVSPTPQIARSVLGHLAHSEVHVTVVTSFAAARDRLATHRPDLLISEVRLGAYNGLHLVLWAHDEHIPSIVIGAEDSVLRRDAERLGATYLTPDCERRRLREIMRESGVPASGARNPRRGTHAA